MMWMRFILMGMFSLTAITLLSYQGVEIYNAFMDYFNKQDNI
ncbi:hypothetical protein [Bacillus sp. Marseille-P3661]|nr:hypothetical protein [Bacillus sp. Marseille-P3661]